MGNNFFQGPEEQQLEDDFDEVVEDLDLDDMD